MPWVQALLKGQKVLAKAGEDGALVSEGGRVEIRYKPNDGRAYRAALANLTVVKGGAILPDSTCSAAEPPSGEGAATPAKARKPARLTPALGSGGHLTGGEGSEGTWIAYSDGACSGNPGPAGSGFIVIGPDAAIHEGYENLGVATNNIAELTGAWRAIQAIPEEAQKIVVHTDSKYAIGVLSQGWKAKANQELIAKIRVDVAKRGRALTFVYVPGHAGVPMNERADELAREAIRRGTSKPIGRLVAPPAPKTGGAPPSQVVRTRPESE